MFTAVYAASNHRSIARYNPNPPSLMHAINRLTSPALFREIFKMDYEVFVMLTNWMCFGHIEERNDDSPFLKWMKCGLSTFVYDNTAWSAEFFIS